MEYICGLNALVLCHQWSTSSAYITERPQKSQVVWDLQGPLLNYTSGAVQVDAH